MLRLADLRSVATETASKVSQLQRVYGLAAVIALVSPGGWVTAEGAGPLHVPVGEEAFIGQAVGQGRGVSIDQTFLFQGKEDVVHNLPVVGRAPSKPLKRF